MANTIIGVYSDPHINLKSPYLSKEQKFQNYIESFQWIYETFAKKNVDMIIDCGDYLNATTLHAEEVNLCTQIAKLRRKDIPEYHVCGNHELWSKSNASTAQFLELSENVNFIVDEPEILRVKGTVILLLPYHIGLDCIEDHTGLVFTHKDIAGVYVNPYYNMKANLSMKDFHKVKMVINGHVHTYSGRVKKRGEPDYYGVGAALGTSFSDHYDIGVPSISIIEMDKNKIIKTEAIPNPFTYLYWNLKVNSLSDFISGYNYKLPNPVLMKITCRAQLREQIRDYLNSIEHNIIYQKFYESHKANPLDKSAININQMEQKDALTRFRDFYMSHNKPKYGIQKLMEHLEKGKENL